MSYLSNNDIRLLAGVKDREWVRPFNLNSIDSASYELSLGDEAYRTDSSDRKIEILNDNSTVEINPGQFALLLTQEEIHIPNNVLAFISIKASVKLRGLVNVSGFHVDPGFKGKLIFSVYNAGPSTITLKKGQKCFLIWFSELKSSLADNEVYNKNKNHHQNQSSISTTYIDSLKQGELASPSVLLKQINENREQLVKFFWAAGIIIGLCIAITLNLYFKSTSYEDGYKFRVKEEALSKNIDSIIKNRVDSILKLNKVTNDTARRK